MPLRLAHPLALALLLIACEARPPSDGRRPPTLAGPDWGTTAAPASTRIDALPEGFRGGEIVFAEHARLGLIAVTITSPATTTTSNLHQATLAHLTARFGKPTQDSTGSAAWPASQAGGALVQLDTTADGRVRVRQSLTQATDHVTERRVLVP